VYAIVEGHSGEAVKLDAVDEDGVGGTDPALFETPEAAWTYLLERFGEAAGREYAVVHVDEIA
jgi:hypothetical protein